MKKIMILFLFLIIPTILSARTFNVIYYEAGTYCVYDNTWNNTIRNLKQMGLYSKINIVNKYSPGWGKDEKIYSDIAKNIMNRNGVDLIIAMGTKAANILLENNNNKIPLIIMAPSDPVESGFITNDHNMVSSNVTTRYTPNKWRMVITTFYDLVRFKNIGLVYSDSHEGETYANYEQWREASEKYGFKISTRVVSKKETYEEVRKALIDLAFKENIDAFYISALLPFSFNRESSSELIAFLTQNGILTFSRDGVPHVKDGAAFGLTGTDWDSVGEFHANQIKKILIDKKQPSKINFIYYNRFTLAANLRTLEILNFNRLNPLKLHLFQKVFNSVSWEE